MAGRFSSVNYIAQIKLCLFKKGVVPKLEGPNLIRSQSKNIKQYSYEVLSCASCSHNSELKTLTTFQRDYQKSENETCHIVCNCITV